MTSSQSRIARAPADPAGGGDAPGGPRVQRPLVPGIPSRRVDPNGVVTQQSRYQRPGHGNAGQPARNTVAEAGELVIGQGITVKGGIRACRRLVVHGVVEAAVPAHALEIGPEGVFEGRCEVSEATIAGRFEGDLVVDGTLTVAPGGLLKGRVRYRTLSVESGGHVSAEIDHLDNSPLPREAPVETGVETGAAAQPADTAAAERVEPAARPKANTASSDAAPSDMASNDAGSEGTAPDSAGESEDAQPSADVAPVFNGLGTPNGEAAQQKAAQPKAESATAARPAASPATPEDSDDAEADAERFYRSLARTSARA